MQRFHIPWAIAPLAIFFCCALQGTAFAKPEITLTIRNYPVKGHTGLQLVEAMDRTGPKQGFTVHAIAQTVYALHYGADYAARNGVCRVSATRVKLDVTQIFPKLAERPSPALARKWKRFMAGVRAHENTHLRLARQLAYVSERTILRTVTHADPNCGKMRSVLKNKIRGIYASYDAKQIAFDKKEHAPGGHIPRLVTNLIR